MEYKAYAKINLCLKVLGKSDEMHELDMINAKINLYDELKIEDNDENKVVVKMSSFEIEETDNLVYKVACYMKDQYQIEKGFKITIDKNIPISAGLGGGSSDCAAAIHLINKYFELNLTRTQKEDIARLFGADVTYCLYNSMAHVTGIGENVSPVDLYFPYSVIVVNPNIPLSTKDVFDNCKKTSEPLVIDDSFVLLQNLTNDLEESATSLLPVIGDMKDELSKLDVKKVELSGSGATLLCFVEPHKAYILEEKIKELYPKCFIKSCDILKNNLEEFQEIEVKPKEEESDNTPSFIDKEDVHIDFGEEKLRFIQEITKDDIYNLNVYLMNHRMGTIISRILFSLVGLAFVVLFSVKFNIFGLIVSILFSVYYIFLNVPLQKKMMKKTVYTKVGAEPRRIIVIVTDKGIYYAYDWEKNVDGYLWKQISKAVSLKDYIYINIAGGGYLAINRSTCECAELLDKILEENLKPTNRYFVKK